MTTPAALLIDIGNTRIKWARVREGQRGAQHGEALRGDGGTQFRRLVGLLPPDARVLAVNVAGGAVERALRVAVRAAGLAPARLLRTAAADGSGLVNGYREPWRLGADRWAAMLGARALTGERRPLCVVSLGTALTLDAVDAAGRHQGGYIAPGPRLAVQALLAGTRGIRRRAAGSTPRAGGGRWPRATLAAIERGGEEACVGAVLQGYAAARRQFGPATRLVITGGAAPPLLARLPAATVHAPDLVLLGLQVWGGRR